MRASPDVRILFGEGMILGQAEINLLEAIEQTGSISAAARELEMSYRHAWLLVDALNRMFSRPLVIMSIGGVRGGGAAVTDYGRSVTAAYSRIKERTRVAISDELAPLHGPINRK